MSFINRIAFILNPQFVCYKLYLFHLHLYTSSYNFFLCNLKYLSVLKLTFDAYKYYFLF